MSIENRKGIYQSLDPDGSVTSDERWRFVSTVDGGMRIESETVRIAPYVEPRNESLTLEIGPQLEFRRLAIRARSGRRESRCDFAVGWADICWRLDDVSRTRRVDWKNDCEIDYNSPLFNMLTLWRSQLTVGRSRAFDVLFLDSESFEPRWMRQVYRYICDEQHATRFGTLPLAHYQLDFGGDGIHFSHFWCDSAGVVFDFLAPAGGGFKLVAVNFPS